MIQKKCFSVCFSNNLPQLNVIRPNFSFYFFVWVLDEKSIIHFSTQISVLSTFCRIMNVLSRIWTSTTKSLWVLFGFCCFVWCFFKRVWCMRLRRNVSISACCYTLLSETCLTCFCEVDGKIPLELLRFPLFCSFFRPSSSKKGLVLFGQHSRKT